MPPKAPKFKSKDAEWTEDLSLYLKDFALAKYVYDAIQIAKKFQLVVNGAVIYSRGAAFACGGNKLWARHDMEWDDHGCLTILDKRLGKIIEDAHANGDPFRIEVPKDAIVPVGTGGGIGENKINAMCVC